MGSAKDRHTGNGGEAQIRIRNLHKRYISGGRARIDIFTGAHLDIQPGESVAVVGASGVGKSTFLHILGTLDRPDRGSVFFQGQDLFKLNRHQLAEFRNRSIGFVFQFHHLLPEFNTIENTMMPALIGGQTRREAGESAEAILVRVGLQDRLAHPVSKLSGGEQQRVALARALILKPPLLLADEPTGNLDQENSERVHALLTELNQEFSMTVLIVTHNMELAACMSRCITIKNGLLEGIH
ncbi:MAG: ABC transporter ATP-binding protein [Desulfobacterales bacterium]|nr:ABC transporter ATP-binding protein [Desulfobacterales bacterium]